MILAGKCNVLKNANKWVNYKWNNFIFIFHEVVSALLARSLPTLPNTQK